MAGECWQACPGLMLAASRDTSPGQHTRWLLRSCCSVGTGLSLRWQSHKSTWVSTLAVMSIAVVHCTQSGGWHPLRQGLRRQGRLPEALLGWADSHANSSPDNPAGIPTCRSRTCSMTTQRYLPQPLMPTALITLNSPHTLACRAGTCRRPAQWALDCKGSQPMLASMPAGQGPARGLLSCHAAEGVF